MTGEPLREANPMRATTNTVPLGRRCGLQLATATALILLIGWLVGPVAQDPQYHDFADQRPLGSLPNAADVLSNLPFCLFGLFGLYTLLRWGDRPLATRVFYFGFFGGVFLTGFGSAYYHFAPDNATLFWDRLPIAVSFISIFCAVFAERVNTGLARRLFPWLMAVGIASVLYWHWLDDLRPYLVVQFGTLLALAFMLLRYRRFDSWMLWLALSFYLLAKLFELGDTAIYAMTSELISGHTLKHLAASLPALIIAFKVSAEARSAH